MKKNITSTYHWAVYRGEPMVIRIDTDNATQQVKCYKTGSHLSYAPKHFDSIHPPIKLPE